MRLTHDPTPNARLRMTPILWFVWAALCIAGVTFSGVFVMRVVTVPQTQGYVGTLKPNKTPLKMRLPAGVPLKSVLVKSGEVVRAGQTVALLDAAAIRAQLTQIERSIDVASVLRACLLVIANGKDAPNNTANDAQTMQQALDDKVTFDRELDLLVRAAETECKTSQRHDVADQDTLERAIDVLQGRLTLISQKLAMVLAVPSEQKKKSVDPFLRAHASVSISMERNDILQKLGHLRGELSVLKAKQDRARLSRVAFLSKDVAQKMTERAVLQTYLDTPRLTVPQSGRVTRVRPIPAGTQFETDETLLEVRGTGAAQFIADLRVPLRQIETLPIGTNVTLSLAGFTQGGPHLRGRIEHWVEGESETGAPFAKARITLTEDSQALLADPRHGIALRGASTASVIRATLDHKSLQATLMDAMKAQSDWAGSLFGYGSRDRSASMQRPM